MTKISAMVSGRISLSCSREASYCSYSPPQTAWYPSGSLTRAATCRRASSTALARSRPLTENWTPMNRELFSR